MQMQKVLSPRNRSTSLDMERENFEKGQLYSITKAINNIECPVKEKHIRRLIIGTFQDKCSNCFWSIVRRMPLQENPITCWKFCHVLHKLLRDGHKKVIADSYEFRAFILDLGKMWGLLKEGYGKLIQNYCTLLVNKIEFHARNLKFPGNMQVADDELDNIGERDVNVFFQLSCEMFDYLDEILCLQSSIFGSLDMSRANSMTNAGQCRLGSLIPCIQDSSQLYDYSVKVLFKLHSALPSGTLDGHRNRFLSQFKILKKFYINSSNLQYFRRLIQVPLLPEHPPNFLLASDINSHVTPVVILPTNTDSPDGSEVDNLINVSIPSKSDDTNSLWSFQTDENSSSMNNLICEKDRMITRLMTRIEELELSIQQSKLEDGERIDELKKKLMEMQCIEIEHEKEYKTYEMERENSQKELEELRQEVKRLQIGTTLQVEANKSNEKLKKFKDIYGNLREEHIDLLRSKAETEKNLLEIKSEAEVLKKAKEDSEERLRILQSKEREDGENLEKFNMMKSKYEVVENRNKKLLSEMALLQQEKLSTDSKLSDSIMNLNEIRATIELKKNQHLNELEAKDWHYLVLVLKELQVIIRNVQLDDISTGNVLTTPEYFFAQGELLLNVFNRMHTSIVILMDQKKDFDSSIANCLQYFYQLCYLFNCGKVLYHTLPNIELGEEMISRCKELCALSNDCNQDLIASRKYCGSILEEKKSSIKQELNRVKGRLESLLSMKTAILPELRVNDDKNLEEMLMSELSEMEKAIQDAADKIQQMMNQSKKQHKGLKLEVNEKILDACTDLMAAIMQLIRNSKDLQNEIVATGKGSSLSSKDFYQRNHRWTEGLISAAKVVALAAKLLVDSADKVICGRGKLEEVMVASQEIAGAVAQLVVSSRVKASPKSDKLSKVSKSSKEVTEAAGSVVGTVKNCRELIEDKESMDFSRLNLHQAKRMEMESKVRLIQLEADLTKERMKLASLRKQHYHLGSLDDENKR